MVAVSYLIDKPGPPAGIRRLINQRLVPPAIDAAGFVESAAYELAEQARARPATSLLAAAALGLLAGRLVFGLTRR